MKASVTKTKERNVPASSVGSRGLSFGSREIRTNRKKKIDSCLSFEFGENRIEMACDWLKPAGFFVTERI
jgi:hypothetical protein